MHICSLAHVTCQPVDGLDFSMFFLTTMCMGSPGQMLVVVFGIYIFEDIGEMEQRFICAQSEIVMCRFLVGYKPNNVSLTCPRMFTKCSPVDL